MMGSGVEISSGSIVNETVQLEEDILGISEAVPELLDCNPIRLIRLLTVYSYTAGLR